MRKLLYTFILIIGASLIATGQISAQSPSGIKLRCPSPYGSFYGNIVIESGGDIVYKPCPTKASIFYGIVDFSHASTIIPGAGMVTGSGTTNAVPRWINGPSSVLGDTPFSWNGSNYAWNNTLLTCSFCMSFSPAVGVGVGSFIVGNNVVGGTFLNMSGTVITNSASNLINYRANSHVWNNAAVNATFGMSLTPSAATTGIFIAGNTLNSNFLALNEATGQARLFGASAITIDTGGPVDIGSSGFGTTFVTFTAQTGIEANSRGGIFTAGDTQGNGNNTKISVDDANHQVTLQGTAAGVQADGNAHAVIIGDRLGTANSTLFTVDDLNEAFQFGGTGAPIFINNDCASIVSLDIAGVYDLSANTACWNKAEAVGRGIALVTGAGAVGPFTVSGGIITSSLGAADGGLVIQYLIIASP